MGKHRKPDMPFTGNGVYGTGKPVRGELSVKSKTGTIMWKATATIFGMTRKPKS